jgi:hypothetical protein
MHVTDQNRIIVTAFTWWYKLSNMKTNGFSIIQVNVILISEKCLQIINLV